MSVVIDGTTGVTTPAETVQGALTTTGNTILGDASTDTLNVGNGGLVKDASGNVGIGTASPAYKLDVAGQAKVGAAYNDGLTIVVSGNAITYPTDNTLAFSTFSTERMRIDSSGNVGIGTSSPFSKLHIRPGTDSNLEVQGSTVTTGVQLLSINSARNAYGPIELSGSQNVFYTNGTERMRIDTSGNLLVGTTSATPNLGTIIVPGFNSQIYSGHSTASGSGQYYAAYGYNGGVIGGITQNGTTAVAYNTTSDYRLKENIKPLSGALARVAALKPCTYTWKSAPDEVGEGFIAHELAEVCSQATTGEKDAVENYIDEEGNEQTRIKPQGIDTSFLVATLTAAIQELKAIVDAQAVRIAALES